MSEIVLINENENLIPLLIVDGFSWIFYFNWKKNIIKQNKISSKLIRLYVTITVTGKEY